MPPAAAKCPAWACSQLRSTQCSGSVWSHCRLEPAGSHGCWGLDDYQFLPYLWGSGQLLGNPLIQPSSIHNDQIVNTYADEYLYLGCIRFIRQASHGMLCRQIGPSHMRLRHYAVSPQQCA